MFSFTLETQEKNIEAKFYGDLDIDGTEVIEEELILAIENFSYVNLNLNEVPFVDSSGIGLLIDLVKTLKEKGITVEISNVREEVMDVFELLQIPDIIGDEVFVK